VATNLLRVCVRKYRNAGQFELFASVSKQLFKAQTEFLVGTSPSKFALIWQQAPKQSNLFVYNAFVLSCSIDLALTLYG
jgi:hypothetical protein